MLMHNVCTPATLHKTFHDRRGEPRFIAGGTGEVTVISPHSLVKLSATVLDVSRSGLQLEVDVLIQSGSIIRLKLRTLSVSGEVARCMRIGSGRYRLGVLTGQVM
jgi:hypothetical protein